MKWVFIVIIALLALILLISFMKLTVKIDILHSEEKNHIKIKAMTLFGLISYTYEVPLFKVDEESSSLVVKSEEKIGQGEQNTTSKEKYRITPDEVIEKIKRTKEILEQIVHFHLIIKKFMRHISIHKLNWNSSIGVGEAASTGMATGALWSLKGGIVGTVSLYMKLKTRPKLSVTPFFQENIIRTSIICIFSFRIGYAILGALRVVKYWKSIKGGKPHGRTSNSRINDNSYGKFEAND